MLLRAAIAAMLLALAACGAGTGEGLDENGQPLPPGGGGAAPLVPTLASIQANIFTPTCAVPGCHSGAGAMLGLRLDPGESAASLINVPSFYGGMIKRVIPGDPDNSFLIQKLEPNPVFGDRMPLFGPYLQQVTVDVVRQWIQDGALP